MDDQIKKKIIPGLIDVHPTECALIVNYQVHSIIDNVAVEKKAMEKIIRVKTLNSNANLGSLAQEVVEKCKYISPKSLKDVEQQLYYLQQRRLSDKDDPKQLSKSKIEEARKNISIESDLPASSTAADIFSVDSYIEGLYEEMPDKIASTRMILQLARAPENLESLASNESLISALSRVLREDGKKSMELVTNIIYIFFCFSNFSHFHPMITQSKIGDSCLKITDQELARYNIWVQDIEKLEGKCAQSPKNAALSKELSQEHQKFQAMLKKQDQLLFVCFHLLMNLSEDLNIEVKIIRRDIVKYLIIIMDRKTPELLMLVVTYLKKLSIFKENKDEMLKNSDEFISKMDKMLSMDNLPLQNLALRLMLNVMHDEGFRQSFAKRSFLPKTSDLLASSTQQKIIQFMALQALYMFSIDDKIRPIFANTANCIPSLIKTILDSKSDQSTLDLSMAIAINVSWHPKNAEIICEDNGLKFLMKRAFKHKDPLLFKLVRNIASHDGGNNLKMLFLDYIDDIMALIMKSGSQPDLMVELLGIIGSLSIPDFDFAKLCQAYKLNDLISNHLIKAVAMTGNGNGGGGGNNNNQLLSSSSKIPSEIRGALCDDDDITLEMIILVGTMVADEGMVTIIKQSTILNSMMELMTKKEEDDEMILQITFAIYNLLLHESMRNYLITQTQIVSYLIDLLYDRNIAIRRMCDACLDIIAEINEEWEKRIKLQKFQWHNAEWLSCISRLAGAVDGASNNRSGSSSPEFNGGGARAGIVAGGRFNLYDAEEEGDSDDEENDRVGHKDVYGSMLLNDEDY